MSPATLRQAAATLPGAEAFVDAAIIGPPPRPERGTTHLVLSGDPGAVGTVAALWSGSAVHPQPAGDEVGQASAAKAAFALYGKGRQALALLARQLAAQAGVADVLSAQGFRPGAEVLADDGLEQSLDAVAWRWGPEFDELAATAKEHGVDPAAVHALREVWRRHAADAERCPRHHGDDGRRRSLDCCGCLGEGSGPDPTGAPRDRRGGSVPHAVLRTRS